MLTLNHGRVLSACFVCALLGVALVVSHDGSKEAPNPSKGSGSEAVSAKKSVSRRHSQWLSESREFNAGDIGRARIRLAKRCEETGITMMQLLSDIQISGDLSNEEFENLVKVAIFSSNVARDRWEIAEKFLNAEGRDSIVTSIIGDSWRESKNLDWMSQAYSTLPDGETRMVFSKYIFAGHLTGGDVSTAVTWISGLKQNEAMGSVSIFRDCLADLNQDKILNFIDLILDIEDELVQGRLNEVAVKGLLSSVSNTEERMALINDFRLGSGDNMVIASRLVASAEDADYMANYLMASAAQEDYSLAFQTLGQFKSSEHGLDAAYDYSGKMPFLSRKAYLSGALASFYSKDGCDGIMSFSNNIQDEREKIFFLQCAAESIPLANASDKMRIIDTLPGSEWKSKILKIINNSASSSRDILR